MKAVIAGLLTLKAEEQNDCIRFKFLIIAVERSIESLAV